MGRKHFKTLLVVGLVLSFIFLMQHILHLKNQINMYSRYTGKFKGTDDDHGLYYTYLSPTRDEWQFPEEVIKAIGIRQGDVIADIGAGSGYFTFKFAMAVGSVGKVYALEIDDLAINIMEEIVEHSRIKGINFDNIIIMKTQGR